MLLFYVIIFATSLEISISSLMKKYAEVNKYAAVLSRGVRGWWELEEPWEDTSAVVRGEPARRASALGAQAKSSEFVTDKSVGSLPLSPGTSGVSLQVVTPPHPEVFPENPIILQIAFKTAQNVSASLPLFVTFL